MLSWILHSWQTWTSNARLRRRAKKINRRNFGGSTRKKWNEISWPSHGKWEREEVIITSNEANVPEVAIHANPQMFYKYKAAERADGSLCNFIRSDTFFNRVASKPLKSNARTFDGTEITISIDNIRRHNSRIHFVCHVNCSAILHRWLTLETETLKQVWIWINAFGRVHDSEYIIVPEGVLK